MEDTLQPERVHKWTKACFQIWPPGKIYRIRYRVDLEFAFHICPTQQEFICADAFTTATNPLHYSGERWSSWVQQAEAGCDVVTLLILWFCLQHWHHHQLLSPQTLLKSSSVSSTCMTSLFTCRYLFYLSCFSFMRLSCVRSPPPTRPQWIQQGIPCCVHTLTSSGCPREHLTRIFAFTHAPPLDKIWRNCRVQCMSESSYYVCTSDW